MSRRLPHTEWCARDHRCNLREHRSDEIVVTLPGYGRAVLTRVADEHGREYAEIRARLALHPVEPAARRQLQAVLADLRDLVTRVGNAARPAPRHSGRTAA
ncbi:hypothetical protein ACTMTJ_31645 [Phytohabitans sp. LJ34]|uniref:hypothetical protein n=1 Tax=Phytohabitans sp. LJ34 TaxID=3452217 RepID=UPI003F8B3B37